MTALVREMLAAAWAQRVFTIVTVLILGGGALTIVLTSGRSAAAEKAVLSTIDAQGTRSISIAAQGEEAPLTAEMVDELARLPEVEDVVGLGPVNDITAAANPDGTRVGLRTAYGRMNGSTITQAPTNTGPVVWLSRSAAQALGLPAAAGAVRLMDGPEYLVGDTIDVPDYLRDAEPLALRPPVTGEPPESFSLIVVLVRAPQAVSLVSRVTSSLLADLPRENVSLTTSEEMAQLRHAVGGELTAQGRSIILGVLGAATLATVVNVWGQALIRRRDIGRRRALGATRSMIVALMVGQVAIVALIASSLGALTSVAALARDGDPLPSADYLAAVILTLTTVATLAAGIPAVFAARRDPLHELRLP